MSFERRDLLLAEGGTDSDGEVARGIQHGTAPLGSGLQATGTASNSPYCLNSDCKEASSIRLFAANQ